jgi:hypothetical protein
MRRDGGGGWRGLAPACASWRPWVPHGASVTPVVPAIVPAWQGRVKDGGIDRVDVG